MRGYVPNERRRARILQCDPKIIPCSIRGYNGETLEDFWHNSWASALADKKVLVIHPFAKSIESQSKKLLAKRVMPTGDVASLH
ncbi:MAG: hypothetical protein ACRCV3_00430 [Desulfovibrionaceae bacterium]